MVAKPDSISIINQAEGKAVTDIAVTGGESIDLSASAMYKRLPLISQDNCYLERKRRNRRNR